jgi:hypothetical protein
MLGIVPPSKRAISAKENDLKKRRAVGKDPKIEESRPIGPVAEVVEEVVLLLRSEIQPAQCDQDERLGRIPEIKLRGESTKEIGSQTSVHNSNGEGNSFDERDNLLSELIRAFTLIAGNNDLSMDLFSSLDVS